jgi:hypothetical protein
MTSRIEVLNQKLIISYIQGVPKKQGVPKTRKLLKSLIVKIECPAKKLNVMMRKILTRCMY